VTRAAPAAAEEQPADEPASRRAAPPERPPERPPGRPLRRPRWLVPLVAAALLAQMAFAMVTTAMQQTPTIDEPIYVGTAVVYLEQHSLRYNAEHPPLGKLIMATGLAFADARIDPAFTGAQGLLGRHVLYEAGNNAWWLMLLARLPMIVLTLLFGLVVFLFARDVLTQEMAGPVGALAALALYAFSPDIIANGSLATLDVPAVGFLLTSTWLLWRARRRPLLYLPLAALALGAALATKMNTLAAAPVLLLLVVLSVWHAGRSTAGTGHRATARRLALGVAAAAGVALVAVAVVWASYLAVDPHLRWAPARVPALGGLRGLVVDWLPFPQPYRDGMRVQFRFENKVWGGFLFGQRYQGSLWYYLPAALLVKTPLGALLMWLAGTVALVAVPRLRAAAAYLLIPTAAMLLVALNESRNFGVRYAIFVPVFLAVAAAAVVAIRWRWAHLVAAALVLFVAVSSLRTFPYYLPYSNEAFGGPASTHRHLHDSNVDWGQDLGRLAAHLRERYPGEPVWLVYKGSGVPAAYGIVAADPLKVPPERVRGLLVVSNSRLARPYGRLPTLVATSRPIDQVGYSITIYRR